MITVAVVFFVAVLPATAGDLREPAFPDYSHRAFTGGNILPSDRAFRIAQTTDGYLWIGMETGVVRYDGTHAERVLPAPAGSQDFLMMAEPDRSLWISRFLRGKGELLRLKDGKVESVSLGPLAAGEAAERRIVLSTLRASSGDFWAGLYFGGAIRIGKDGRTDRFGPAEGLPQGSAATLLAEDREHRILIGTATSGIYRLAGNRFQPLPGLAGLSARVEALFTAPDGVILAGTDGGVFAIRESQAGQTIENTGLPVSVVKDVIQDRRGAIWTATNGDGVYRSYHGKIYHFTEREGLSSNIVRGLYEDREGSVWCATRGGIDQFTPVAFNLLTTDQGLPGNAFDAVLRKDGEVWLSRWGGGLYSIRGNRILEHPGFPAEDSPVNLAPRSAGGIWFGSVQGRVGYADRGVVKVWNAGSRVDALIESGNNAAGNNSLWAALRGHGIAVVREGSIAPLAFRNMNPPLNLVRGFARTPDGAVWIADSLSGLWRVSPDGDSHAGEIHSFGPADGLPANSLPSAVQVIDGRLIVASPSGLSIDSGNRFRTYGASQGFCSDEATEIADDRRGGIWLGGPGGIYRIGKAELLSGAASLVCRRYGQFPGSASISLTRYSHPVIGVEENGQLWFLAERGIAVVRPELLMGTQAPPLATIEEVRADGSLLSAKGGSIGPGVSRVQFAFRAIGFAPPEPIRFRYRLEGLENWRESPEPRSVEYTNLAPGEYTFRVDAVAGDTAPSPVQATFPFRIRPHFYQTFWFYCVSGASALLLARFVYLLRVRQLRKEFAIVLEERNRMAREIHDTLLQGFAGVAWQLDTISKGIVADPNGSRSRLEKLMLQLDRCMLEARQAISSMRKAAPAETKLEKALQETGEAVAAQQGLDFRLRVLGTPRDLPPLVRDNVYSIAREAMLNVRHASASGIDVEVAYSPGGLRLRICDDGKGIEDTAVDPPAAGHWGMIGMRERARLIGGDLEISRRSPKGAAINVFVPLDKGDVPA